ncbi:MAG: 6-carboxytetrahydropterin synthase [Acidobacteriota bacterium]
MQVLLTVKSRFSAAHRLLNPDWDDAKNYEVFGSCYNPNGHGHDYSVEVTVEGPVSSETGMILNLKQLKDVVEEEVIRHVDHKHLNHDVPFLEGLNPTAENLAQVFWRRLEAKIPAGRLYEVRIFETENNIATVRGND